MLQFAVGTASSHMITVLFKKNNSQDEDSYSGGSPK